jgi:hypothetical protein
MIAQGHELKVRLLWAARNRLPGRIGGLLAAAIILIVTSGVSATAQELDIEPNLTEPKASDLTGGMILALVRNYTSFGRRCLS